MPGESTAETVFISESTDISSRLPQTLDVSHMPYLPNKIEQRSFTASEQRNSASDPSLDDVALQVQNKEPEISFWSSRRDMNRYYSTPDGDEGLQIEQYFNCLNFIQIQNVFMAFWCVIGWLPHAVNIWNRLKVSFPQSDNG